MVLKSSDFDRIEKTNPFTQMASNPGKPVSKPSPKMNG